MAFCARFNLLFGCNFRRNISSCIVQLKSDLHFVLAFIYSVSDNANGQIAVLPLPWASESPRSFSEDVIYLPDIRHAEIEGLL
ncbi:hypothetical protein Nepgr_005887 [Nepenthes gracilis]|uniref:Uncharacterized protein n=1 Tax=Nepenthes gracilis TaxID=150966 RepID=A0AAD3XGW1_NEPGR|nr:hypothetical protein Nepgr_005887 [Nepenthes gracilis]